jgi:PKD repeat protein
MFNVGSRVALLLALAVVALIGGPTASAAPPTNDAFADAVPVSSLPFSDSVVVDEASMEPGEGLGPCTFGSSNAQTVWYALTAPDSGLVRVSDGASFSYQFIAAYRQDGFGLGGLTNLACASWNSGTGGATFNVEAGQTYYIQAGSNFASSGSITISVQFVAPPSNDDFADATPLTSVPFSGSADTTAATVEAGEPVPACPYGASAGTVWYAFTPPTSGSYSVSESAPFGTQAAVYTGPTLGTLTQLACRAFGPLTFHADADTTYYVQAGGVFGFRGPITVTIDTAPNPVANMFFNPGDPTRFDTTQFYDGSYDPAQVGIGSWSWDFGDGTTSASQSPTHRYASDGDYTVTLAVATVDGRTASVTRPVHVQTHDVTIAKVTVPQSARAGQTRDITIGLTDSSYPETVQVQLLASTTSGWTVVGTLTQTVPDRGPKRTTDFAFSYTFTPADAALGKVSFRAVATIVGARDALPGDNDVAALPTRVT